MWLLFAFLGVALLAFVLRGSLQGWYSGETETLLETSFALQHPVIHGREVPASSLRVLYRWRTHLIQGQYTVMEADANWLCQTADGLFVVAIGQGEPNRSKATFFSLRAPFEIRWTWRSLSEERVRQMLAPTPGIYREVFGAEPGAAH